MRALFLAAVATMAYAQSVQMVTLPAKSPLVTIRLVFRTGAAFDPPGKHGAAALTARMLAQGGTRSMTYQQIVDAMFPMATQVDVQTDKEMTAFRGETHIDNLEKFYALMRSMVLEPGWRPEDLSRLRDDQANFLRVTLRGNNDEELGKEALYTKIYRNHPYGHHNMGTVSHLLKLTMEDLKEFHRQQYTQANLIVGLAGGYPAGFEQRVRKDFGTLPAGEKSARKSPAPQEPDGLRLTIVDKETRSVAVSFGFPLSVRRGDPDFLPLLVVQSYFGQHRNSGGRLYQRMREARGLNYGDYAYIEYFPEGMFQFQPDPNLARQQQIFQVWLRPLEPPTAHFGLRLALFELDRLIKSGLTGDEFARTRLFLSKNVNLLLSTKTVELGYAIDSLYYGIPDYITYVKGGLAKLTLNDVNRAIRKHLRPDRIQMVLVAKDGEQWKRTLLAGASSPMKYNAPKPKELLEEDKLVENWPVKAVEGAVEVVAVDTVFE